MANLSVSNQQWLVTSLDRNQNKTLEELEVAPELKARLDSNKNDQLESSEVAAALQADSIVIEQGKIVPRGGQQPFLEGRETLVNVHKSVNNTLRGVGVPRVMDGLNLVGELFFEDNRSAAQRKADRDRYLSLSNVAYLAEVSKMRNGLRTVADMTANATDAQIRAIHQTAKKALDSSLTWGTGVSVTSYLIGVGGLESINNGLQVTYSSLKSTLNSIEKQSAQIPDPAAKVAATDKQIAAAFSQVANLETLSSQSASRLSSLAEQAQQMDAKVTGRTGPYALIGAGAGAVAGAAAGYFLGGNQLKTAAIGAGVGSALTAGAGALIGKGVDQRYRNKATDLRQQMQAIEQFDPAKSRSQLQSLNQNLYDISLQTQGRMGLDQAHHLEQEVGKVDAQTQKVLNELATAQKGYGQEKK